MRLSTITPLPELFPDLTRTIFLLASFNIFGTVGVGIGVGVGVGVGVGTGVGAVSYTHLTLPTIYSV